MIRWSGSRGDDVSTTPAASGLDSQGLDPNPGWRRQCIALEAISDNLPLPRSIDDVRGEAIIDVCAQRPR